MKVIALTQGREVVVDDEDHKFLAQWRWRFEARRESGYACRTERRTTIYMHQLVAERYGLDVCEREIDHKDGNGLNNQRTNLRAATRSQNNANQRVTRRNRSGYKGVYWSRAARKWAAQLGQKYLGLFENPLDAAIAYNDAATARFGEFARLNLVA